LTWLSIDVASYCGTRGRVTCTLFFESGLVVLDRGYADYAWFSALDTDGVYFVTRMKNNAEEVRMTLFVQPSRIVQQSGASHDFHPAFLFDCAGSDGLNEISIGRLTPVLPHERGDLSSVINAMKSNV